MPYVRVLVLYFGPVCVIPHHPAVAVVVVTNTLYVSSISLSEVPRRLDYEQKQYHIHERNTDRQRAINAFESIGREPGVRLPLLMLI